MANLIFNSRQRRSTESAVNEARGIIDVNIGTVASTTDGNDLDEIKLAYPGAKYIKNQGDALVVYACFKEEREEDPVIASDFQKLTILEGYNWEVPNYISTTLPVLTGAVWSGLTRPGADLLILGY